MSHSDYTLTLERFFEAPPERVFAAWTETQHLSRWFGPENVVTDIVENTPAAGGSYRFVMREKGCVVHGLSGEYRVVEPPTKLVMTWKWDTADAATLVTVDFVPRGEGTLVKLKHEGFPSREVRDNHDHGWTSTWVCLERVLAR